LYCANCVRLTGFKRAGTVFGVKPNNREYPYRERAILVVDLSKERYQFIKLEMVLAKKMLGGRLMALSLWNSYCNYQKLGPTDYEEGNPIVIAAGSASDLDNPILSGFVVTTRSPVTGGIVTYAGHGGFAKVLYGCGVCAMVIQGRRSRTTVLGVRENQVTFSVNEQLHNLTISDCRAQFPSVPMVAIGPAAEQQVMQSSVNFDGENLGRAGIGVVFSRKNLKAITFFPTHKERTSYNPQDLGRLSEMVDKMEARQIPRSLISYANKNGWCAINGFQDRVDGRLWALEGQKPLLPSIALGANLGLFDPKHINPIIVACSELGLDPFSCGVLLLWLADKGTVDPLRTLESIAYGKGFAMDLPAKVPASFYKIGNLELAPFDLRALPPQALLASLGDDTIVFPCLIHGGRYRRGRELHYARMAVYCQDLRYTMESLGVPYDQSFVCFNQYLPFLSHPFRMLARLAMDSEGYPFSESKTREIGKACYRVQKEINRLLGYVEPEMVPDQLTTDPSSNHPHPAVVVLPRLIEAFHFLRSNV